jgi:Cap4 dsDNA endonuclease
VRTLKEQFAAIPRETAGSRNSNRTDYQKDWAICHLLELHDSHDAYALVVERHDDVVVLNCPVDPTRADFYQLKTKDDGDWKLSKLLYVEKSKGAAKKKGIEKKMSFLAKLYSNRLACDDCDMTASFVSNARFALILANGEDGAKRDEICLSELSTNDLASILAKLKEEHGLEKEPECASYFYFRRSDLGVNNHSICAQGKIAEYLERRHLGDAQSVVAFYRTLFEEIKRRTNYEAEPGSFEAIIQRKSITKDGFQAMIDTLGNSHDFENITMQITTHLQQDGLAFTAIRSIVRDCKQVFLERRGNKLPNALFTTCEQIVKGIQSSGVEHSLKELIDIGIAQVKTRNIPGTELFKVSVRWSASR